jgi:peptidoglycan hydrolase-like protein with peptidoglycan-binding domain
MCCAHKEWARPVGRKSDVGMEMDDFRRAVARLLAPDAPAPTPIPRVEPGGQGRPTLRRGAQGDAVLALQRLLRMPDANGRFGPRTEAAVREFQRRRGMVPDGIVGPKSWQALDAS